MNECLPPAHQALPSIRDIRRKMGKILALAGLVFLGATANPFVRLFTKIKSPNAQNNLIRSHYYYLHFFF